MRPAPHQPPSQQSGRIIYLGDVRRRRNTYRRAPDRQYLGAISLVAALAWCVWLVVFLVVPPARLLTYVAFFLPFCVAVSATSTVAWYAVEWRRGYLPSLRLCVLRGVSAGLVLVWNLALLAAHHWRLPLAAGFFALAFGVNIAVSRLLHWH